MTSETDYHQFELKDQKRPIRPKLLKLTDDGRSRKKSKFKVIGRNNIPHTHTHRSRGWWHTEWERVTGGVCVREQRQYDDIFITTAFFAVLSARLISSIKLCGILFVWFFLLLFCRCRCCCFSFCFCCCCCLETGSSGNSLQFIASPLNGWRSSRGNYFNLDRGVEEVTKKKH